MSSDQEPPKRPKAAVVSLEEWRKLYGKSVEQLDGLAEGTTEDIIEGARLTSEGRAVASLALLVVATLGFFMLFEWQLPVSETVVETSTSESKTHHFDGDSKASLSIRTKMRTYVGGDPRHVRLDRGAVDFELVASTKLPFRISTDLVEVNVSANARFTVLIDTTVSLHVYDGKITVTHPGAAGSTIILKGGDKYRVPVSGPKPVAALAFIEAHDLYPFTLEEPHGVIAVQTVPRVMRFRARRSIDLQPMYCMSRFVPSWMHASRTQLKRAAGAVRGLA